MHCSFDDLISKHTNGQIIVLMAGFSVLDDIRRKAIEEVTGKRPSKSMPSGNKQVHVKTKDLKKMSMEDHKRFFDSALRF